MDIDPASLAVDDRYKLLIGGIVPRPIALVSTLSPDGRPNLAPFSFFNGVCSEPMTIMFCPANRPDGGEKDTLRNCAPVDEGGTGECVVNVVSMAMLKRMAACAEPLMYGESEWNLSGLTMATSKVVKPSRVSESPMAYECRAERVIRLNPGVVGGGNIVIARVVHIWAQDGLINDRYHIDATKLDATGRMGGLYYCTTRERIVVPMGRKALK